MQSRFVSELYANQVIGSTTSSCWMHILRKHSFLAHLKRKFA